ncbi:MAG: ATP-binding protein [Verrucomicrobia bacterium]|nr:ATP-binding protein [Verrucomicrobiota bacterium]
MTPPDHAFLRHAGRILNSGQARSIVLTGNINDLFGQAAGERVDYVPLMQFLAASWSRAPFILVLYELNGPIRFLRDADQHKVRDAWLRWRVGLDENELAIQRMLATGKTRASLDAVARTYDESFRGALNNPTLALELLRQMCLGSRTVREGRRLLDQPLLILIEGADLLLPEAPVSSLSDADRHRVTICQDWFGDPDFLNAGDAVVLLAESRSLLHHRVARLPQLLEVEVPAPDETARHQFIEWFQATPGQAPVELWSTAAELARLTAGLSLHALRQLLMSARHERRALQPAEVVAKVEGFIQSQLGEDIVEFKKPTHSFKDVVGFRRLKQFLKDELIPRFLATGPGALTGAAVCGPIGSGKTYIFEAVAAELDLVVIVLKNIRSQWFGQTDVIFERLRRVLNALAKVLIFIDEADTQFGGVGADTHETERRLTGKLQAMMSDPANRGRVLWLLVTARIHQLSPDLRRPGRVGDLIIPILDPEGEDRRAFLRWMVQSVLGHEPTDADLGQLDAATRGFSAAGFASLRSELRAKAQRAGGTLDLNQIQAIVHDQLPPPIGETRRFQTLQALVNCTRRSLLPDPHVTDAQRHQWEAELRELSARGVR